MFAVSQSGQYIKVAINKQRFRNQQRGERFARASNRFVNRDRGGTANS